MVLLTRQLMDGDRRAASRSVLVDERDLSSGGAGLDDSRERSAETQDKQKKIIPCRNAGKCAHLLRGSCFFYHSEKEVAEAQALRSQGKGDVDKVKQAYCEVVKRVLLENGVTSRSSSWLMTRVGVSCPKPDVLPKLRQVLEACPSFVVETDESNGLIQYVYLSAEGQGSATSTPTAPDSSSSPSRTADADEWSRESDMYLERVRNVLSSSQATGPSRAMSATALSSAVLGEQQAAWHARLVSLLQRRPEEFGWEGDAVWLLPPSADGQQQPKAAAETQQPEGKTSLSELKAAYLSRVRAFLLSVGATSRDKAVLATHLGLKVSKPSDKLGKLTSLIEEAPDTFGLEQDPNERAVNHIWLLRATGREAGGKASPQRPVRKLSSGSYTKSRSSSLGNAADLDHDSRQQHGLANHVRRVLPPPPQQQDEDEDLDDADKASTSSAFVTSVIAFLRQNGATDRSKALALPVLERACPKPLLLSRPLTELLGQCSDQIQLEQDPAGTCLVWLAEDTSSERRLSTSSTSGKPSTPRGKLVVQVTAGSTPGAGDGGSPAFSRPGPPSFLPTDPATPTPTKPASTPAPVDAPTGVPSTGSSSMTDMRSVKDPSAQSSVQARYCEQVQSYLQGRRAFSRSAAVTLQSLGVAVPRPQALTKIRPALEESPLFHLEQDPVSQPVQWIWLADSPKGRTTATATSSASSSSSSSFKPSTGSSPAAVKLGVKTATVGKSFPAAGGSSSSFNNTRTSGTTQGPPAPQWSSNVLQTSELFHPSTKKSAYQASIQRLRDDIIKLRDAGIIEASLQKSLEADCLEFLGDAVLRGAVTRKLIDMYKEFYAPAGLHQARMVAEQRHTLAKLFDDIGLRDLMVNCPADLSDDEWKPKCDVVEAILGELDSKLNDASGVPVGHAYRKLAASVIDRVATAAIDVGQSLKHPLERKKLIAQAKKLAP